MKTTTATLTTLAVLAACGFALAAGDMPAGKLEGEPRLETRQINDDGRSPNVVAAAGGPVLALRGNMVTVASNSAAAKEARKTIDCVWRPLPNSLAEGLLAQRVELWESNRLWHMLDGEGGYMLAGFESRPGRHPWQGEHVGKWLHAATLAYERTGNAKLRKKLQETVERLLAAQEPNGYLGTYAGKDRFYTIIDTWRPCRTAGRTSRPTTYT